MFNDVLFPMAHLPPTLPPVVAMVTVTLLLWCSMGNRVCSVCSNFRSLLSPLLVTVSGALASPPTPPPPLAAGTDSGGSLHLERSWIDVSTLECIVDASQSSVRMLQLGGDYCNWLPQPGLTLVEPVWPSWEL